VKVALTLGSLDHAKCFSAELLPLLALRLAGRLAISGNDDGLNRLGKIVSFEGSVMALKLGWKLSPPVPYPTP
jgi:hypothetical protein